MALDARRQAILNTFFHTYSILLDYFDALDDAVSAHPEWCGYTAVSRCINPAAYSFGVLPLESIEMTDLSEDFLGRIEGSFSEKFPKTSPVFSVLSQFRDAVVYGAVSLPPDAELFRGIAETLSADCYRVVCSPESTNLQRPASLVVVPSNYYDIATETNKKGGPCKITLKFSTSEFTFDRFVNLPFHFFHEYLSHIHSEELFAEKEPADTSPPFEDGWLLYAAHCFYCQQLYSATASLSHPCSRDYYAAKYISEITEDKKKKWVQVGYQQAKSFEEIVGAALFWKVTLLLATTPFNHIAGCFDLHQEFVIRAKSWIRRVSHLPTEQRSELIRPLVIAVEDEEAVRKLMDSLL